MDKRYRFFGKGSVAAAVLFAAGLLRAAYLPGLQEGYFTGGTWTTTKPGTSTLRTVYAPEMGGTTWTGNYKTYVYTGQIYLDGSTYWFAANIDDRCQLKIAGTTVISISSASKYTTGKITKTAGWYDFEVRFYNSTGSAGIVASTNNRDMNDRLCGFGMCRQATAPTAMSVCTFPVDDGKGTLFRYSGGTQSCLEIAGTPDQYGTPSPDYGYYPNLKADTDYTLTCPMVYTNVALGTLYRCAGWTLKKGSTVTSSGTGNTCTYHCTSPTDGYTLTWKWEPSHYKLDVLVNVEDGGTVDVPSSWMPIGTNVVLTAKPSITHEFWKWTGEGLNTEMTYSISNIVTMSAPRQVTANFYDPYAELSLIRFVTPTGAGDADGTGWENAYSNVVDAYNAVAANPGGGEVWIRYGAYACKDVVMSDNVIVRGGFSGDETSADQADPDNNPTILHDGTFKATETWNDSAKSVMWSESNGRYIFHEPPTAGDTTVYKGSVTASATKGFVHSGRDISPIAFHGITFTRYGSYAISVTANIATPVVLRKCRFVNIGWQNDSNHAVLLNGIGLDAEACEFVGAQEPVYLTAPTGYARRASVFNQCRFFSTSGYSGRCGGIHALQNTQLTLVGCTFDRNLAGSSSGTLYANIAGDLTIEDCVFSRGRCDSAAYGGALCYNPTARATLTIRRSRFENCVHTAAGVSGKSAASALSVWGSSGISVTGIVENVAFIGNTYEVSTSYPVSSCMAFCAGSSVNYAFNFVNCLFERNRAVNKSSSAYCTTVGSSTAVTPCAAFVNCVFKDNVCGYTSGSTLVRSAEIGANLSTCNPRFAFVNTVFDNEEPKQSSWLLNVGTTYKPFSFANCATCAASGYGTTVEDHWSANASCFRLGTLASGVTVGMEAMNRTNGLVVARKLAPTSGYRRKGCLVWRGTDGGLYLYDATSCGSAATKPWVACWTSAGSSVKRLTTAEAAALGLATDNTPIPDAFDVPREGHPALGNLNAVVRGLRIGIKKGIHR